VFNLFGGYFLGNSSPFRQIARSFLLQTNHLDNSARYGHISAVQGFKKFTGKARSTVSYEEIVDAQVLLVIGSDITETNCITGIKVKEALKIFVYCAGGDRSREACEFLSLQGYVNVYNLRGGIKQWIGPTEAEEENQLIHIEKGS